MFQFSFSITKRISRDTSSFPIDLDDVKARSEYFRLNPSDDSFDTYISSVIIPKVVLDWELATGYLLLDTSVQAFVPSLQLIRTEQINILFEHLNIREFTNIKYYPYDWDYSETKTTFDSSNYFLIPETGRSPAKLNFKDAYLPIQLFGMENNLEANYKAGFEENDFTDLSDIITDALATQVAMIIDSRNGLCQNFFSEPTSLAYANYSINKQEIVVI